MTNSEVVVPVESTTIRSTSISTVPCTTSTGTQEGNKDVVTKSATTSCEETETAEQPKSLAGETTTTTTTKEGHVETVTGTTECSTSTSAPAPAENETEKEHQKNNQKLLLLQLSLFLLLQVLLSPLLLFQLVKNPVKLFTPPLKSLPLLFHTQFQLLLLTAVIMVLNQLVMVLFQSSLMKVLVSLTPLTMLGTLYHFCWLL